MYIYIIKLVNREWGCTLWKSGCWKLYQREISQRRRAESEEEGRTKDMHDIHGDISLGTLPVRTESDPRRRDTRQSQNI